MITIEPYKKPSGYYKSIHIFGRSELYRIGDLYFIRWQKVHNRNIRDERMLTQEHYSQIKKMLSREILETTASELTDKANSIIYKHKSTPKAYQKVRRFLVKHKYLKEE